MQSRIALALVLVLVIAASVPLSLCRLRAHRALLAAQAYEDVYYLPPPGWLPMLSLGYREALADLLWMRALVYFGDEVVHRGELAHVFDYTDALLALDPDFEAVYHWIGTAGVYRPSAVGPEDIRRAAGYMRRGLERFPRNGRLAWDLGATLAFELPPLLDDPHAADEARAEGADYMAMASRLGAMPEWAVLSNAAILARVGRAEAAVRHLEEMYATIDDEAVRADIEAGIAELRSEAYSRAFAEASREEELQRLREMPYVHPDLFFLVGRRAESDDWRRTYREGFAAGVLEAEIDGE